MAISSLRKKVKSRFDQLLIVQSDLMNLRWTLAKMHVNPDAVFCLAQTGETALEVSEYVVFGENKSIGMPVQAKSATSVIEGRG